MHNLSRPPLYNVIYISFKIDWNPKPTKFGEGITGDIKFCVDNGFNILMIAFLEGSKGYAPIDALLGWQYLSADLKKETLDYAHSKGAKILLSVGGAEDHIDGTHGQVCNKWEHNTKQFNGYGAKK